jgi:hypothetical protein
MGEKKSDSEVLFMKANTHAEAIKKKCLHCGAGTYKEVVLCPVRRCSLYPYRFGFEPGSKRYLQKLKMAKRKWPTEFREVRPE